MLAQGYVCVASPLGNVYYLPDGVTVAGDISINYMEYPWITCFEVSGLGCFTFLRQPGYVLESVKYFV